MARFDSLLRHPNFNQDDMDYLLAKGWSVREIYNRWTEEFRDGKAACQWAEPTARAKLIDTLNATH